MDNLRPFKMSADALDAQLMASLRPMAATLPESGIIAVVNYGHDKAGLIPLWSGEGDLPFRGGSPNS